MLLWLPMGRLHAEQKEGGVHMKNYVKIQSARYPDVILRAVPGHFITPHAHVNYYLDFTPLNLTSHR